MALESNIKVEVELKAPRISQRKKRISEIAQEIIGGQVSSGTLDPNNEAEMDKACRLAVSDAAALYDAAIEYIS